MEWPVESQPSSLSNAPQKNLTDDGKETSNDSWEEGRNGKEKKKKKKNLPRIVPKEFVIRGGGIKKGLTEGA